MFFEVKKMAIIKPSFQFLWYNLCNETIPICRGMAWLPLQKGDTKMKDQVQSANPHTNIKRESKSKEKEEEI